MIAGVAGGIAEYFAVDPVVVRLAFLALIFVTGVGILLYIVGMVIIPEAEFDPFVASEKRTSESGAFESSTTHEGSTWVNFTEVVERKKGKAAIYFGVALIATGTILTLKKFVPGFNYSDVTPYLLVLLGIWILFNGRKS